MFKFLKRGALVGGILILLFAFKSFRENKKTSGILTIKDGYFYDNVKEKPWFPLGISYQTWIKDIGQWQPEKEIIKALDLIKKLGANSVRVDFVWKHIETSDNHFNGNE